MSKKEFLNFAEISKSIEFINVLNWLNIPFKKTNKELKGDGFIVSIEKNLFFSPQDDKDKGSIINFVSQKKNLNLRDAALLLKQTFLIKQENKHKREIPNLQLTYDELFGKLLIKPEVIAEYEVGYIKQRSIMSGKIGFKIYNHEGSHLGYIVLVRRKMEFSIFDLGRS